MILFAHINAVAGTLDGGVLAPPEVRLLPGESVERVFRQLTTDRATVLEHWPAVDHADLSDAKCPIDGQSLPCTTVEQLCGKYGIALGESDDVARLPRSALWPTEDHVVHIIRRMLAKES